MGGGMGRWPDSQLFPREPRPAGRPDSSTPSLTDPGSLGRLRRMLTFGVQNPFSPVTLRESVTPSRASLSSLFSFGKWDGQP